MAKTCININGTKFKPCPNCGSQLIVIHRKRKSFCKIECNGDCWTQTSWHLDISGALEEWNSIKPTNHEEDSL